MFYCEGCENEEQFTNNEEAKKQEQQQPVVEDEPDQLTDESPTSDDEQLTKSQLTTVEQPTNNSISIQKQPTGQRGADNVNKNNRAKYSMSLPREIPDMLFKYARKKSTNKQTTGADGAARKVQLAAAGSAAAPRPDATLSVSFQNVTNASLIEELKRDMVMSQAAKAAAAAIDSSSSFNRQSSSLLDEDDDDDNGEHTDKFNEENNIGEAISYLASSIIAKDGRELFGYQPSRRVHVNCISQSYF